MRNFLFLLALAPLLAQAEIYRWTDEQGRVHFGQRPQANAERVEVRPQVLERDAQTRERENRSERFFQARRDERTQREERQQAEQLERDRACGVLRSRLQRLEAGRTFYSADAQGDRHYYSDAEVEAARRELRARVVEDCN